MQIHGVLKTVRVIQTLLCVTSGHVAGQAMLDIGSRRHDFGRVMQGERLTHGFRLGVRGKSDLVIRQAKSTCGCVVGRLMLVQTGGRKSIYRLGDPIHPGQEIVLHATFDTRFKRGRTHATIAVLTNAPASMYELELSAEVVPFLTATPELLDLGDLPANAIKTATIVVRTDSGTRVILTREARRGMSSPPPGMQIDLLPVDPDPSGRSAEWRVRVTAGPKLREGPLGYVMALVSDARPVRHLNVFGGRALAHSVEVGVSGRVLATDDEPQTPIVPQEVASVEEQPISVRATGLRAAIDRSDSRQGMLDLRIISTTSSIGVLFLAGSPAAPFPVTRFPHEPTTLLPIPVVTDAEARFTLSLQLPALPEGTRIAGQALEYTPEASWVWRFTNATSVDLP